MYGKHSQSNPAAIQTTSQVDHFHPPPTSIHLPNAALPPDPCANQAFPTHCIAVLITPPARSCIVHVSSEPAEPAEPNAVRKQANLPSPAGPLLALLLPARVVHPPFPNARWAQRYIQRARPPPDASLLLPCLIIKSPTARRWCLTRPLSTPFHFLLLPPHPSPFHAPLSAAERRCWPWCSRCNPPH